MANIKTFLEKLMKLEGGYINHPNDKGGCTNKGITISTFQHYYGSDKTCEDLKQITEEQVEYIYRQGYLSVSSLTGISAVAIKSESFSLKLINPSYFSRIFSTVRIP